MMWLLISVVLGYAAILLLVYFLQSQLVYHPHKSITATPADLGYEYENVTIVTEDNNQLHGWFVPADTANLTVLYFHGNAGNISGRMETIQLLHQLGLNVFIFDYRGYGQSEGHPTEEGTYRDAEAAWNYLQSERDIPGSDIVIMGRSLGGSVAAWLAARKNPAASIIETTFTSAADLGADLYPWLPVRWMIKYEYNTLQNIQEIDSPVFMSHSRADQVVPFHHSKKLFEAANQPKVFLELEGTHASGFLETGVKYRDALKSFLQDHTSYQYQPKN